ncbi:MAG: sulfatase [Thermoproteota archaeon]
MPKYNLIIVVLDSFRQDHVSYYNRGEKAFGKIAACRTPNLDRFASESIVFENAYPAGLPTIPVRTELMTGQFTLPYRPWSPMHPTDISIAEILKQHGYVNSIVTDTYHLFKPGMNFHKGFDSFIWIRGQEYDAYNSAPPVNRKVENYVNKNYTEQWVRLIERYLANTEEMEGEEDCFPARVFKEASKWLRRNRSHEKVFLWVDSFDPHEPWDPPNSFDNYTDPNYSGARLILPMGGEASRWASEEEVDFIRGLYAGEASLVDHWFGFFYNTLEELGHLENSIIVVLADHGHPLADHGKFLKGGDRLYNELLKAPFLIRPPGGSDGRKTRALIQFIDLLPTLLDFLGFGSETHSMHGKSFLPVVEGDLDEHRKYAVSGYNEAVDRCIRDSEWSYVLRPEGQPDELYNLLKDPKETTNLIDEKPEEAKRLASAFGAYFKKRENLFVKGLQGKYELS